MDRLAYKHIGEQGNADFTAEDGVAYLAYLGPHNFNCVCVYFFLMTYFRISQRLVVVVVVVFVILIGIPHRHDGLLS